MTYIDQVVSALETVTTPKPLFSLKPLDDTTWLMSLLSKVFRFDSPSALLSFYFAFNLRRKKNLVRIDTIQKINLPFCWKSCIFTLLRIIK